MLKHPDPICAPDTEQQVVGVVSGLFQRVSSEGTPALGWGYADFEVHLRRRVAAAAEATTALFFESVSQDKLRSLAERICRDIRVVPVSFFPFQSPGIAPTPEEFVSQELHRVATLALAVTDGRSPSEDEVRWAFRHLCLAWQSTSIDFVMVAPMSNVLGPGSDPIQITPSFHLEYFEELNHSRAFPTKSRSGPREDNWILPELSCLVEHFAIAKTEDFKDFPQEQVRSVTRAVTAMRLAYPGHFGCRQLIVSPAITFLGSSIPMWRWSLDLTTPYMWGAPAIVRIETGMTDRCRIVTDALDAKRLDSIVIGLERFNWSFARATPEDKVIDLLIALENSLLAGTDDELSYRLGLRGAAALASTAAPGNTNRFLRLVYAARSAIVHGGHKLDDLPPKKLDGLTPAEFANRVQGITRQILDYFVDRAISGSNAKATCAELDDAIVRGMTRST